MSNNKCKTYVTKYEYLLNSYNKCIINYSKNNLKCKEILDKEQNNLRKIFKYNCDMSLPVPRAQHPNAWF